MEVEAWMVAVLVVVISMVFLGIVATFGMGNKTFDEVMEEQKKQQKLVLGKPKVEKKNKEKKKIKKKTTKPVSSDDETPSDKSVEKAMEVESEPEVAMPPPVKPLEKKVEAQQMQANKENKPVLKNRQDHGTIKPTKVTTEELHGTIKPTKVTTEELNQAKTRPLEDTELMHKQMKQVGEKKVKKERELAMNLQAQFDTIPGKKSKKVKAPPAAQEMPTKQQASPLLASVQAATLTDPDADVLIETLLNKQGKTMANMQWTKKGDPMVNLKKQLDEKDRVLHDEQVRVNAANKKLKELHQELSQERKHYSQLEASTAEKMAAQNKEIAAFQLRMQMSHDQHLDEMSKLHLQMKVMQDKLGSGGEQVALLQGLREENSKLREQTNGHQQHVKIITDEMTKNALKINSLESKVRQYEDTLGKMENKKRDTDTVISQISQVTDELRRSEGRNVALERELDGMRKGIQQREADIGQMRLEIQNSQSSSHKKQECLLSLENKLRDSAHIRTNLEAQIESIQTTCSGLEQQHSRTETELTSLKQQNAMLTSELETKKAEQSSSSDNITLEEHSKLMQEKGSEYASLQSKLTNSTTEYASLQSKLTNSTTEIDKLTQNLEEQKKKNNEADAFCKKVEEKCSNDVAEANKKVHQLQEDLNTKVNLLKEMTSKVNDLDSKNQTLREGEDCNNGEVSKLQSELDLIKKENHELRAGCEKATVALTKAEKSAEEIAMVQSKLKTRVSEVHTLQDALAAKDAEIEELRSSSPAASDQTEKFAEQEKKLLLSQVEHYKTILAETEGILNKLQSSVESQEEKWQLKTKSLEEEVSNLKQEQSSKDSEETSQLQNQIKTLEERLSTTESEKETLKTEIDQSMSNGTNGVSNLEVLQGKLEQTQRELEQEKQTNKQLSQRLGAPVAGGRK